MRRIKICGITSVEDMRMVADAGADAIGLVFYPPSSRFVTVQQAVEIVASAPPFLNIIGLFVNAKHSFIGEILANVKLSGLQFHGEESYLQCSQWQRPWIKAGRVKKDFSYSQFIAQYTNQRIIKQTDEYLSVNSLENNQVNKNDSTKVEVFYPPSALLFDAYVEAYGGQGASFNWQEIPKIDYPWILSGGLNVQNINEALHFSGANAVDVSSGVEISPGKKDRTKVREFIKIVREY